MICHLWQRRTVPPSQLSSRCNWIRLVHTQRMRSRVQGIVQIGCCCVWGIELGCECVLWERRGGLSRRSFCPSALLWKNHLYKRRGRAPFKHFNTWIPSEELCSTAFKNSPTGTEHYANIDINAPCYRAWTNNILVSQWWNLHLWAREGERWEREGTFSQQNGGQQTWTMGLRPCS